MLFILKKEENIKKNGENPGYCHFLLFLQCFRNLPFSGLWLDTKWQNDELIQIECICR